MPPDCSVITAACINPLSQEAGRPSSFPSYRLHLWRSSTSPNPRFSCSLSCAIQRKELRRSFSFSFFVSLLNRVIWVFGALASYFLLCFFSQGIPIFGGNISRAKTTLMRIQKRALFGTEHTHRRAGVFLPNNIGGYILGSFIILFLFGESHCGSKAIGKRSRDIYI